MVLNGVLSQPLTVLSAEFCQVLFGPLLFLLYINDICDAGISKLVLYANNILLYQAVHSPDDHTLVHHDVNTLAAWSSTKFNPTNMDCVYFPQMVKED